MACDAAAADGGDAADDAGGHAYDNRASRENSADDNTGDDSDDGSACNVRDSGHVDGVPVPALRQPAD